MIWLVSQILFWILLAAGFGGLIGWALCGYASQLSPAEAPTEANQTERLDDVNTVTEQANEQVRALLQEVEHHRDENSGLRAKLAVVEAAIERQSVPPEANAATCDNWRLRFLESRNTYLENKLGQYEKIPTFLGQKDGEPIVDSEIELTKLKWRNRYLEARTSYLLECLPRNQFGHIPLQDRANGVSQPQSWDEELEHDRISAAALRRRERIGLLSTGAFGAAPAKSDQNSEQSLIWRNRYLEGRVRYLEEENRLFGDSVVADKPCAEHPTDDNEYGASAIETQPQDQLNWRSRYLEERLQLLEKELKVAREQAANAGNKTAINDTMAQERLSWRMRYLEFKLNRFSIAEQENKTLSNEAVSPGFELVPGEERLEWRNKYLSLCLMHAKTNIDSTDKFIYRDKTEQVDLRNQYLESKLKYVSSRSLPKISPLSRGNSSVLSSRGETQEKSVSDITLSDLTIVTSHSPSASFLKQMQLSEDYVEGDSATGRPASLSAPSTGNKDDLKRISGVGPKIEKTLNGLGVYYFRQIAEWTDDEMNWVNGYLSFKGRIQRDKWVDQCLNLVDATVQEKV